MQGYGKRLRRRFQGLQSGRINGFGTHEDLLEHNDIYRDIYESQTGGSGDFDD